MLDIAWTEILIIAMVAILVVGPRELPRMLRGIGKFMGQVRRTAGDFQRQFNDALREAELDDVKRGFDSVRKANPLNKIKDDLNPLKQAGDSVRKAVEDPGAPKPQQPRPSGGTTAGSDVTSPSAKPGKGDSADSSAQATPARSAGTGAGKRAATPPKQPAATKPSASAAKPKSARPSKPVKGGAAKAGSGPAE